MAGDLRSRRGARAQRLAPLLAIVALATCAVDGKVRYAPERDDTAMERIASRWIAGDGTAVELCDDIARSADWTPGGPDACLVDHVVRGGGRGVEHVEDHGGVGCGGCPFGTFAYVRGTLQLAGSSAPEPIEGDVTLGSGYSDNPYMLPYDVYVECSTPEQPCALDGRIRRGDGALEGDLTLGAPGSTGATKMHLVLTRAGPAACDPSP